jgi:[acyl-carrier-protein] S-malonyltransferase
MQNAVGAATGPFMVVVSPLSQIEATQLCSLTQQQTSEPCCIAAINSANQITFSGSPKSMENLSKIAKEWASQNKKRVVCKPLNVSAPFHSELMVPAQQVVKEELERLQKHGKLNDPVVPFVSNISPSRLYYKVEDIVPLLVQSTTKPVEWYAMIQYLKQEFGSSEFLELGPGQTLTNLIKPQKSYALGSDQLETLINEFG